MRYTTTSAQINHLRKEGQLLLEHIYPDEAIEKLRQLIKEKRGHTGRDLHRDHPLISSILNFSMLGQIAAQLFGRCQLKIAFTQSLPCYQQGDALQDISSVTESVGGGIIDLQTGDTLFILPETLMDFPHLEDQLLVVFCKASGRYVIKKRDPYNHWLKKSGYASGDRLADTTHPLIHK